MCLCAPSFQTLMAFEAQRRSIEMRENASPLDRLGELGQSVWIDYLSRDLLESGELHGSSARTPWLA